MIEFFRHLDRRWIFLAMFFAIAIPILTGLTFPEDPSPMVRSVFQTVDDLPEGSSILIACDYDPASKGELEPMDAAFTRHCALKKHKIFYITLWPGAVPMIKKNIDILEDEFPNYKYGVNYVNLGFQAGQEGVIKVIVNELQDMYSFDDDGTNLDGIPITRDVKNIQQMDLIINISAGTPGAKEWIQYAATPYGIPMIAGTTGVGAPPLYPYIPDQLTGILGAIKAAAEYEQVLLEAYPEQCNNPRSRLGQQRMGSQLVGHLLIIGLIVVGNIVYFSDRKRGKV